MAQRWEDLPLAVVNPSEVLFYGWERRKDPRIIWAIINSIRQGRKIPPVPACPRTDGGYDLDSNWTDHTKGFLVINGGHNRTLAHLIEGAPMNIALTEGKQSHKRRRFPVEESIFKEARLEFRDYKARHPWADFSLPNIDYMQARMEEVKLLRDEHAVTAPLDHSVYDSKPDNTLDIVDKNPL